MITPHGLECKKNDGLLSKAIGNLFTKNKAIFLIKKQLIKISIFIWLFIEILNFYHTYDNNKDYLLFKYREKQENDNIQKIIRNQTNWKNISN